MQFIKIKLQIEPTGNKEGSPVGRGASRGGPFRNV